MRIISKVMVLALCISLQASILCGANRGHSNFANNNKNRTYSVRKHKPELAVVRLYKAITNLVNRRRVHP